MFARTAAAVTAAHRSTSAPPPASVTGQRLRRDDEQPDASPERTSQQAVSRSAVEPGPVMVRRPARIAEPFPLPPRLVQTAYAKLEVVQSG